MNHVNIRLVILVILVFSMPVIAQCQLTLSDYIGTWRWNSGNGDTFLLVLKPVAGQRKLIGYHSYIKNGVVVENNIPQTPGRTYDSATVSGELDDKGNLFYLIRDVKREAFYMGKLAMFSFTKERACFYTTIVERKHLIFDGVNPIPRGRTFPDNLILDKVY
jgi:hypothetical protein